MRIRWTPSGFADIQSLHDYLQDVAPSKTAKTISSILEALDLLAKSPHIGRKGRVTGTRELVLTPYIVAYRLKQGVIEILAVQHGSQRWPDSFD